jgi:hypothetical protein
MNVSSEEPKAKPKGGTHLQLEGNHPDPHSFNHPRALVALQKVTVAGHQLQVPGFSQQGAPELLGCDSLRLGGQGDTRLHHQAQCC